MSSAEEWTRLAKRLELAGEADRELDYALECLARGKVTQTLVDPYDSGTYIPMPPLFTRELDAAVSLIKSELGWFWRCGETGYRPGWAHLNRLHPDHCNDEDEATGWGASAALSLCIAFCQAKAKNPTREVRP